MEILHRAEKGCPGHGAVSLDCSILGRMLSPVSLARSFMCVCLLGREHLPARPIPNLISSRAVRRLRVIGNTWMQDPLGASGWLVRLGGDALACLPIGFILLLLGGMGGFLSLVEKVLPENSSIPE